MSFFGKKTTKPAAESGVESKKSLLIGTGGQIDEVVLALLKNAHDGDENVRLAVSSALHDIGYRQPLLVVSAVLDYIHQGSQSNKKHEIVLLEVMNKIIDAKNGELTDELRMEAIKLAIREMTRDGEVIPDLQTAAANTVLNLSTTLPDQILDALLERFPVGKIPHYFVIKTLGDVFSTNPSNTVPRLKDILSRMTPVLGSIKHDNMKWVFATAISQFCDSLLVYAANLEPGTEFDVSGLSDELYPSFEILLNKWLNTNEKKLKIATVRSLAQLTSIFTIEQYETNVGKVVPLIMALLKEKDPVLITQSLGIVLEAGIRMKSVHVEALLSPIIAKLHIPICSPPDYSNGLALKNYNEVLRCFEIICKGFSDFLLTYILQKFDNKDPSARCGWLTVLKHLVISCDVQLEDKKARIVSGIIQLLVMETSLIVKKSLAQLVISMASFGYLQLEGGHNFVEFIVRLANYDEKADKLAASNANPKHRGRSPTPNSSGAIQQSLELKGIAENILNLASTTIPEMTQVLWPFLFELMVPRENKNFANAMGTLAKTLSFIAGKKRDEDTDDYIIDFDRLINLPKPQKIIATLFVLLAEPFERTQSGSHILAALQAIGPILHPSISDMWDEKLPKMILYLKTYSKNGNLRLPADNWSQKSWEDLVVRLMSETVRIADDDEWSREIASGILEQMHFWSASNYLRKVGLKLIGIVLQKLSHKDFVQLKLDEIFKIADHSNDLERLGCAMSFGFAGASHLDIVLEKLLMLAKEFLPLKRSGGLFGLGGGKSKSSGSSSPFCRSTVFLAFGYVTSLANASLIMARIEIHVLGNLTPHLKGFRSVVDKEAALKSLNLIAKAVHPSHLKQEYTLRPRNSVVELMINILQNKDGVENSDKLRSQTIDVCSSLVLLSPRLEEKFQTTMLEAIFKVFSSPVRDTPNSENERELLKDSIDILLSSVISMEPTVSCLVRILQLIEPYCNSDSVSEREVCCKAVRNLLQSLVKIIAEGKCSEDSRFEKLGHSIALLIPRTNDSSSLVRQYSIECIGLMLFLDHLFKLDKNNPSAPPASLVPLNELRDRCKNDNMKELLNVAYELARILCSVIEPDELGSLLLCSINGLLDTQDQSAYGACVVVGAIIKQRGNELLPRVSEIMETLFEAMDEIKSDEILNGALHAVKTLGQFHLPAVTKVLLAKPLPFNVNVTRCFQTIAKNSSTGVKLLFSLMDTINNGRLFDEHAERKKVVYDPLIGPMAATHALSGILEFADVKPVVKEHFSAIFGSLLLRIGTAAENQVKACPQGKKSRKEVKILPSDDAISALHNFINLMGDDELLEIENEPSWKNLPNSEYYSCVGIISGIAGSLYPLHPKQKI